MGKYILLAFMFIIPVLYGLTFCSADALKVGGTVESFSAAYSREATDSKECQLFTEIRMLPTLTVLYSDKYCNYSAKNILKFN